MLDLLGFDVQIGCFGLIGLLMRFLRLLFRATRWFLGVGLWWLLLAFGCCAFRMLVVVFGLHVAGVCVFLSRLF